MTRETFNALPHLLPPGIVVACGYAVATLNKYAAHGILTVVKPPGCGQRRFRKAQVASMLGWNDAVDRKKWAKEKPLLSLNAVREWTGYKAETIRAITKAGGLTPVQPGGVGDVKYRKAEVGEWLGL